MRFLFQFWRPETKRKHHCRKSLPSETVFLISMNLPNMTFAAAVWWILLFSLSVADGFVFYPLQRIGHSNFLLTSVRIKIHGTKNAFTTLQNNDVVLYKLKQPKPEDKHTALAAYSSSSHTLSPLCREVENSNEFFEQPNVQALPVDALKDHERILRIISSNKVGNIFVVDEYINEDVHVPLLSNILNDTLTNGNVNYSRSSISTLKNKLVQAETCVESLKLQIASMEASVIPAGSCVLEATNAQAVKVYGMVYISGCMGTSAIIDDIASLDIIGQTKQCLENLKAVVESAGSSVARICNTTIFLSDIADASIVNTVYVDFLTANNVITLPSRSTIGVALPPGALVEIEAVASL